MNKIQLSDSELLNLKVGDGITVTTVIGILSIAIIAVIVYKLFSSNEGKTTIPGGWTFQWK